MSRVINYKVGFWVMAVSFAVLLARTSHEIAVQSVALDQCGAVNKVFLDQIPR